MSRHRRPEPGEQDVIVTGDDPATGPLVLERTGDRVVIVPQPRPASEPVSAPAETEDPEPEEPTDAAPPRARLAVVTTRPAVVRPASPPPAPVIPEWASLDEPARVRREWADAPGGFVRVGLTGPRTLPPAPLPVVVPRRVPVPLQEWGPWPPEPGVRSAGASRRRGSGAPVVGTIAVLVVLVVVLGAGLLRPDLLGLSAGPLFSTGEPGPGTVTDR